MCDALKLDSDDVRSIDGELLPRKRDILVDQLRSGDFKYLVTTDIKSSKLRVSERGIVPFPCLCLCYFNLWFGYRLLSSSCMISPPALRSTRTALTGSVAAARHSLWSNHQMKAS